MNKYCPSCCWCMFFIDSLHVHGLTCLDVTFIILFFYFLPSVCVFELVYFCGGLYELKVQCWIAIILCEYFSLKTGFLVIKFPTSCHECCCVHNFILTYNFMEMFDQFAYLMGKQFFWQSKLLRDLCISLPFTVVSIFSYALFFDANYFLITCCPKKKERILFSLLSACNTDFQRNENFWGNYHIFLNIISRFGKWCTLEICLRWLFAENIYSYSSCCLVSKCDKLDCLICFGLMPICDCLYAESCCCWLEAETIR